jgi:tetratricopeptide (TPR) repeat protein/transcriptional regulator with XRE-family HTH domain
MAKRGDPSVLRYVVSFLRCHSGMTQKAFGKACRVDQAEISRFELGKLAPIEEQLRRMAKVAEIEWPLVVHVRQFYTWLLSSIQRNGMSAGPFELKNFEPVLIAVSPYLMAPAIAENIRPTPQEECREAEQIWTALERHPVGFRRQLIDVFPGSLSWALAVRVCEASVKSAAHKVEEARELAELAVCIAERVAGEETWRPRLLGYCWAHVGNARRVANDLAGADESFSKAWDFWRKGTASGPEVLAEWRLLSLVASLRRAQRRLTEALDLIGRARACQGEASFASRINLIMKEVSILSRMGEPELALRALSEAAPLCEASGDRQMLFAFRFNMADALCQLERFEEAAELLRQIRELALQQGNELDLIRVGWLDARVAAGEGRIGDAIAGLEQASQDFTDRELPYNAALSSLDLAVLLLRARRTAEVRKLAVTMGWIFRSQGIDREALGALKLFCDAALQERATVELARKVIADIEEARCSAPR